MHRRASMTDNAKRPNVLVIITDDQGFGDCSFYGNPVLKTPHMDTLATEGVSFGQFHVTPMCAPTRGAFMSGVHPLRNMALSTTDGRHCLRPELPCMPQAFADAGYRTALFGKWHQGRNWPNRPQDKGFQYLRGFYGFGTTGISCRWNCDYQDPWLVDE
ncbi:MAG: sulfatase-like hydrolase/transferase, partial [Chitinivibrionales bacterium]|nr:sulfatase-like hydrolase/transferase [Chitinivibrionales bacterium]